jgi:hypothetical protein
VNSENQESGIRNVLLGGGTGKKIAAFMAFLNDTTNLILFP